MSMSEEINNKTAEINIEGDRYAAANWELTTHFADREFARSAASVIAPLVEKEFRHERPIDVMGLGSGSAVYESVVCEELKSRGVETNLLVVADRQMGSLRGARNASVEVSPISVLADLSDLPISTPPPEALPRLILSRAIEHYFSDEGLAGMLKETARVMNPGDLYITQLSSADEDSLPAISAILHRVSGKAHRYFGTSRYIEFVRNVTDEAEQQLFDVESKSPGEATPQPRGTIELARRYLNGKFIELNTEAVTESGLNREWLMAEIKAIADTERSLSLGLRSGEIAKDQAVARLDAFIGDTSCFKLFRSVVLETAKEFAGVAGHAGEDLIIMRNSAGNEDVQITFRYPIILLKRSRATINTQS